MCQNTPSLPIHIDPVGTVRSTVQAPTGCAKAEREKAPKRPCLQRYSRQEADLVIDPKWEELLDGIDDYSHLMVLYWPHLLDPAKTRQRKIHPMGCDELPLYGVFATRTPGRPNPILVTVVKLLERKGNILRVQGLEAVDGSPILDIKPHTTNYCAASADKDIIIPQWMRDLQQEATE